MFHGHALPIANFAITVDQNLNQIVRNEIVRYDLLLFDLGLEAPHSTPKVNKKIL